MIAAGLTAQDFLRAFEDCGLAVRKERRVHYKAGRFQVPTERMTIYADVAIAKRFRNAILHTHARDYFAPYLSVKPWGARLAFSNASEWSPNGRACNRDGAPFLSEQHCS